MSEQLKACLYCRENKSVELVYDHHGNGFHAIICNVLKGGCGVSSASGSMSCSLAWLSSIAGFALVSVPGTIPGCESASAGVDTVSTPGCIAPSSALTLYT